MLSTRKTVTDTKAKTSQIPATYASRFFSEAIPKYHVPNTSMPAAAAYQLLHDELNLDANPALNLASFVTTWMEPEANKVLTEAADKNFVDEDEYPQTKIIHDRVISMMAHLFNAPKDAESVGTATIGSSEAIMLGNLAHKWAWKKRREAEGNPTDKPNIIFGADVHTCWEKFALYFDVEMRVVPMKPDQYILTAEDVAEHIDENTISVGCVLGTTFTGQIDEIQKINDLLEIIKKDKGWDIPIHVDGASGGFIAPFVYPDVLWDFRLPRVKSINVSNHKFGMVYPGMGTLVFRDRSDLPEELVFHINYLGGDMPNYSLNFSRASTMVLLQYYNFIRLGMEGYGQIMKNIMDNAHYLEQRLLELDCFELLNESKYLPVVVVRLKQDALFTVFELSDLLRQRGWVVPAYTLPPDAQDIAVLRMVVRENFSHDMAEMLVTDIQKAIETLEAQKPQASPERGESKHRVC